MKLTLRCTHLRLDSEYMISYEDFLEMDIRVAEILVAEAVEESEKLIRLEIDLGADLGHRQILAGLKATHDPKDLVGRHIIVLANLEPRTMMGMESQGMLLAAEGDDGPVLLAPDGDVEAGSIIK